MSRTERGESVTDSGLTFESVSNVLVVEISPESRRLVAMSPAELRLRGVYNQLNTFAVAFLGMFVPLLAMVVIPSDSECFPHYDAYLTGTIVTGVLAVVLFGYAFLGNWREDRARAGPSPPQSPSRPVMQ